LYVRGGEGDEGRVRGGCPTQHKPTKSPRRLLSPPLSLVPATTLPTSSPPRQPTAHTPQLKVGKITAGKSYVPAGLTASQYAAARAKDQSKKDKGYAKNVAKAGKFEDYTEFYTKRGTDVNGNWLKSATRGHRMVKTKYDYSGTDQPNYEDMKQFEGFIGKTAGKKTKKK
jgi:hypothetical protein